MLGFSGVKPGDKVAELIPAQGYSTRLLSAAVGPRGHVYSLNLATLTTRFVYPQFSLEGKRLWIVGLAPLGLTRVVKTKYWLASIASLCVTLGLIWLSCHMLKLSPARTLYFGVAVTVMTFTLNGLAIGLGALYPNFKEDNPGKIVSGFVKRNATSARSQTTWCDARQLHAVAFWIE